MAKVYCDLSCASADFKPSIFRDFQGLMVPDKGFRCLGLGFQAFVFILVVARLV